MNTDFRILEICICKSPSQLKSTASSPKLVDEPKHNFIKSLDQHLVIRANTPTHRMQKNRLALSNTCPVNLNLSSRYHNNLVDTPLMTCDFLQK